MILADEYRMKEAGCRQRCIPLFMHSPMRRKYAAKAAHGGRRAGEDGSSPTDFVMTGDSQSMDFIVLNYE